jgi:hypothetical protein
VNEIKDQKRLAEISGIVECLKEMERIYAEYVSNYVVFMILQRSFTTFHHKL